MTLMESASFCSCIHIWVADESARLISIVIFGHVNELYHDKKKIEGFHITENTFEISS